MSQSGNSSAGPDLLYAVLGGFLGAGKTAATLRLAEHLSAQKKRVALITNDQGVDLVDTARVRAAGFAAREITGGCFCCKFDSLLDASRDLIDQTAPDALIAEPVGSCTDLKATVILPLRKMYGHLCRVAPLSVLVDPRRCARVLGLEHAGRHFSDKVVYVYRKQLEEADILIVNKIDTIDRDTRGRLVAALKQEFPGAKVLEVSCITGEGLPAWFDLITMRQPDVAGSMEVDYDIYADGEARLGWFNARVSLTGASEFDGNALLARLAADLRDRLAAGGIEIAHLKMVLVPDPGADIASISLTRTDANPDPVNRLAAPLDRGTLIVNLRAEADPDVLRACVSQEIGSMPDVRSEITVVAAFRPGRPVPTHRIADAASA